VYGTAVAPDLSYLDQHVSRARAVVGRWLGRLETYVPDPIVHSKAFQRVNANIAPAAQGKESSKDCLVFETYLEIWTALRAMGLAAPIVFLSSNTREYVGEGRRVKASIATELGDLNVLYAPNVSAARHYLGFGPARGSPEAGPIEWGS
jgi:hypothetical protein